MVFTINDWDMQDAVGFDVGCCWLYLSVFFSVPSPYALESVAGSSIS